MNTIEYIKLRPSAKLFKTFPEDTGFDVSASIPNALYIDPGKWTAVNTGIILRLPLGIDAQIRPRSGLALKYGITVLNTPGTIDNGYRGELKIILINHGTKRFYINDGDRIAQIIFSTHRNRDLREIVQECIENAETPRGADGFGSTGV